MVTPTKKPKIGPKPDRGVPKDKHLLLLVEAAGDFVESKADSEVRVITEAMMGGGIKLPQGKVVQVVFSYVDG